jgi:glycosyltransferase involved in cell wall biosynthesis
MKLIIQIPCFNEEDSLPHSIPPIPKNIKGIDTVEILLIDDGSTDKTREVARSLGVKHIVGFKKNQGLAKGFMLGLKSALELGADIVVNTDADNQYDAKNIPDLIKPILENKADIVVGERPILGHKEFSITKKVLQRIGSFVVRVLSGTDVKDAPSGFRAFSRDAALQLNVYNRYTYTLETLIQAGNKGLKVESIPINVNPFLRPSRLFTNMYGYVKKSLSTMIRYFIIYNSFKFFLIVGSVLLSSASLIGLRFVYFYIQNVGEGKIQSLILGSSLGVTGVLVIMFGFISDMIATNRQILEKIQYDNKIQKLERNKVRQSKRHNAA